MKILKAKNISPDDVVIVDLALFSMQLRRDQRSLLFIAPIFTLLLGLMGAFRVPQPGEHHYGLYLAIFIMLSGMCTVLFICPIITIVRRHLRKRTKDKISDSIHNP